MIQITQMLTILGEHLPIVLVGGAEALAAIVLIGRTRIKNESMGKKKRRKEDNPEQILLDTLNQRKQEVCILVRRRDMMPVYVAGNLEVMTGISASASSAGYSVLFAVSLTIIGDTDSSARAGISTDSRISIRIASSTCLAISIASPAGIERFMFLCILFSFQMWIKIG